MHVTRPVVSSRLEQGDAILTEADSGALMTTRLPVTSFMLILVIFSLHFFNDQAAQGQTSTRQADEQTGPRDVNSPPLTYSARTDTCFKNTDVQANGQS